MMPILAISFMYLVIDSVEVFDMLETICPRKCSSKSIIVGECHHLIKRTHNTTMLLYFPALV